ncbi:hypothetical protein CN514_23610, partial [Bacillus sp. AFS001701]|uniref:hypothetical protein n=1 Tax=Bacillus sp. AFS001701 TaxID=2033480 RepID=UPI000BFACC77
GINHLLTIQKKKNDSFESLCNDDWLIISKFLVLLQIDYQFYLHPGISIVSEQFSFRTNKTAPLSFVITYSLKT